MTLLHKQDMQGRLRVLLYEWTDSDDVVRELCDLLMPFITQLIEDYVVAAKRDILRDIYFELANLEGKYPRTRLLTILDSKETELMQQLKSKKESV